MCTNIEIERRWKREREAKRKQGKKQRGDEIEDEACDTEKETEKSEELCIDFAMFTVKSNQNPDHYDIWKPDYRDSASFPCQA